MQGSNTGAYLFSKKIKCLRCNGNMRGISERGIRKYYCSTYHNYRTCIRYKVLEDELVDLVYNHHEIRLIQNMIGLGKIKKGERGEKREDTLKKIDLSILASYVKVINIDPDNQTIEIIYQDNTFTKITSNRHIY